LVHNRVSERPGIFRMSKLLPKLLPAIALVIARQIYGDAKQPGGYAGLVPEASPVAEVAQEALLGQRLRSLTIAQDREQQPQNALLVQSDDLVKLRGLDSSRRGGNPHRPLQNCALFHRLH